MSHLSIQSLNKDYPDTKALVYFDLQVEQGEFIVIVGPSGCGKSTLLRTLAGLEKPSSGEIWINNKPVHNLEPQKRPVSMMFQSYTLFPHLNVYENIAFGLKARGSTKQDIENKVSRMAQTLHIQDYLNRMPNELSGGQRQRVALGRALLKEPEVLLLDEPLSHLDAQMRTEMRMELQKLHQSINTTMILVTHDQIEAMTLADRIVVMENGKIEQIGPPTEIYHSPANTQVARFIGSPGMNLIEGFLTRNSTQMIWKHHDLHWTWNIDSSSSFHSLISKDSIIRLEQAFQTNPNTQIPISIGIRPEHVSLNTFPDSLPLTGTVLFTEPMGSHTLHHLQISPQSPTCVLSLPNNTGFEINQRVSLYMDSTKLCFFSVDDGSRL